MNKELTKEEAEEYYNKLWLENKELIQENIDKLNKKRFAQTLMLAEKDKEIERLKEELKYTIPIVEHNKTITKHLKEIERLNNIINKALEKSKGLQYRFGYVLDDLTYLLMQGSDKE